MIKEYGVDPGCLDSEAIFFRTMIHFGLEKLRLIRKFPKSWENKVIKALKGEKPKAKHRVIEYLTRIKYNLVDYPKIIDENSYEYSDAKDWLINAEDYHVLNPFDGIISDKNPHSHDYIERVLELNADADIFNNDGVVRRNAVEMAKAVRPLLMKAKQIHFVDPRFGVFKDRHVRPLCEFIKILAIRLEVLNTIPQKIIYHTQDEGSAINAHIETGLKKHIAPYLPNGTKIEIIHWPKEEMHNRYILTEVGGVDFHIGLDDDDFNPENENDKITPILAKNCLETRGRLARSEKFMSCQKVPSIVVQGELNYEW